MKNKKQHKFQMLKNKENDIDPKNWGGFEFWSLCILSIAAQLKLVQPTHIRTKPTNPHVSLCQCKNK
jgi:hypothetical protein